MDKTRQKGQNCHFSVATLKTCASRRPGCAESANVRRVHKSESEKSLTLLKCAVPRVTITADLLTCAVPRVSIQRCRQSSSPRVPRVSLRVSMSSVTSASQQVKIATCRAISSSANQELTRVAILRSRQSPSPRVATSVPHQRHVINDASNDVMNSATSAMTSSMTSSQLLSLSRLATCRLNSQPPCHVSPPQRTTKTIQRRDAEG